MASDLSRLDDVKKIIRCLLVSRNSQNVTLNKLNKMYKDIVEEDIPYKDFYFTSLEKFLKSMPDVLNLNLSERNELCAIHIDTELSRHISSLVAREKQLASSNAKSRTTHYPQYRVNPVDPRILSNVLEKLKNYSLAKKKIFISKTDVLSAVSKCIGKHAFYGISDLNSQLHESTHIFIHDDNYIYFKNISLNDHVTNMDNGQNDNFYFKNFIDLSLVANLIKESTKTRLKVLIEKYTEGIWCSELPQFYQQEFGISLEYSDLGFNSIVEFAQALPDIFQIVQPLHSKKFMVLNANVFKDIYKNQKDLAFSVNPCSEDTPKEYNTISSQMMEKYCKALIPNDAMAFDDTVDQIRVNSLIADPIKSNCHVIISEIHNPSFFWLTLYKNKKKISHLMSKLQNFYKQESHNYKVPQEILKPGLHITCIFAELWHRGIVKKIKSTGSVVVHFYDYGTNSTFNPDQLYFLKKTFSILPAQAIPCSLNNVKPCDALMWSKNVNKIFTKKVFDQCFIADIIRTNDKNNSVVVDLIDTNNNLKEKYVSQWLIDNKLAKYGSFLCQINNQAYIRYQ